MAPVFSLFTHANEQYANEQPGPACRLHRAVRKHVAPHESPLCFVVSVDFFFYHFMQAKCLPCTVGLFRLLLAVKRAQTVFFPNPSPREIAF